MYEIVKKAVSDVVKEEVAKLRLQLVSYVSDEEMREIEEIYSILRKNIKSRNLKSLNYEL